MLRSFFGRSKPARKTTCQKPASFKPRLEMLEVRTLLSAAVIDTIGFGPARTGAVAANPVTNRVYLATEDVPAIHVIDSATDAVLAQIPTLGYQTGIAVNPANNRVYVSQQFARSVRVIDGATNTIVTDLAMPGVPGTIGHLAVNPATHRLYVGENDNNILHVFDTDTNAFLHDIALPSGYAGPDINVDTALNRIYVTGRFTANVTILDGASESMIAMLPTVTAPVSIAVDSVHHRAYVSHYFSDTVSVIDGGPGSPTENTVVTTIPVGSFPGVVGVNATTEHVYVANNADHTVTIIDGSSNTVIETVPMPAGASTLGPLTVVPGTNRIYVVGEPSSLFVIEDSPESLNQPPTDIAPSNASVPENQPSGTVVGALTTTDPDAGDTFTYTLVGGAGATDNASFTIGAGGNLKTAASFNFETKSSYSIRIRSTDAGGLFVEKIFTISVTNVNEVPTITVPAAQTAYEDVDQAISGLSVGDVDGPSLAVTLAVGHGTLTLGTIAGLTVTGNGSGAVSLSGSVADLNAALATLVYRGSLNYIGPDTLAITASDGSLNSMGSVAIAIQSAAQQAGNLQAQVNALLNAGVLNQGQANSLNVKLNLKGNSGDIGKVRSFLHEVAAYLNAGILIQAQADALTAAGNILLTSVTRR